MAALEQTAAVGRDERERVGARPRKGSDDDVGRRRREAPQPVLLPAGDDRAHAVVVGDRRARRRESEPSAGALRTAAHRPRGRRATAFAERRPDARQRLEARDAHDRAAPSADEASHRQQQLEHEPKVGPGT